MQTTINQSGRNGLVLVDYRLQSATGFKSNLKSFLLLLVTITLVSCGGGGSDPAPVITDKVEALFSTAGGMLEWTATNNQSTAALTVPDGALDNDTIITIQSTSASVAGLDFIPGTVLEFGPDGLVFNKPVNLVINYDPAALGGISANTLKIYRISNNLPVALLSTVDTTAHTITASITGFSTFGAAVAESTPPVTSVNPAGGNYDSLATPEVSLTCSDTGGSGCAVTYYTLDGTNPTTASTVFTSPISITTTSILKFFSVDNLGNSEAVKTENYTIIPVFTIGGTVSGSTLTDWLWLDLNGVAEVSVSQLGTFVFPTVHTSGYDYAVTVKTSPAGQNCSVINNSGIGTISNANVTSISVECTDTLPPLLDQTIAFGEPGPVNKTLGDANFSNLASGGAGTGDVSYSSSDNTVAIVNANSGEVTLVAAGSVTITATKAADTTYNSAQATYTLVVAPGSVVVPNDVVFSAWVGATITEVTFPAEANGLDFIRSTELDCDIANYSLCANGQLDVLNGMTVTDTAATLSRTAWYSLQDGNQSSLPTPVSVNKFSQRTDSRVVAFNNRLWVIGGRDSIGNKNDVWSSSDGASWVEETTAAEFTPRTDYQVVVFNNKLWLIAGDDVSGFKNDIWSSSDGVTWTLETAAAAFSPRYKHQVVAFNGKLWLIGGQDNSINGFSGYKNDVWSSSDGVSWTEETAAAGFSPSVDHQVLVFNGKLWFIGVNDTQSGINNDVWSSTDGVSWSQETAAAEFSPNSFLQAEAFNNKLWIIAGTGESGFKNDVWSSGNGVSWSQETAAAEFTPRLFHQTVTFNNKLWIIGGVDATSDKNDVWSSDNGVTWTEKSVSPQFSPRMAHQMVAFNGKLWLIGGESGSYKNDAWSSSDGVSWTEETAAAGFSPRNLHQVVDFNNKLWLIGGYDGSYKNDVWSSSDGVSWVEETAAANFSPRTDHQVVVFNNKMWLIGGYDGGNKNDVWSSSDGVSWVEETATAGFSARLSHQIKVFNNKLWLIGGYDGSYKNDVWSSSDGVSWIEETAAAGFSPRTNHQVGVLNGKLWLIGGRDNIGNSNNEVWSSINGLNWNQETVALKFSPRISFQVEAFNNMLYLLGGNDDSFELKNDVWRSIDGASWSLSYRNVIHFQ